MNLHNEIINISFSQSDIAWTESEKLAAKMGHRDARHAAAELAIRADAVIDAARLVLSFRNNEPYMGNLIDCNASRAALKSLYDAVASID